ncbi:adenylate cyclase [Mesorhizobium sp. M00.F.Ca.ET.149.01.1.1]|nr:adenylate cyclase [Mesorhizobium sp. M00.F.Ca.ET.149.01.1.1]
MIVAEDRHFLAGDDRVRQPHCRLLHIGQRCRIWRISDGRSAKLTLKFGDRARERDEFEYSIPLAEAEELMAFAIGRVIEKTRHHVRHRGYLYEVDVFGGRLAGLVIAELETPEDVSDEMLPDWLGREVTGESRYYNASLALGGIPEIAA